MNEIYTIYDSPLGPLMLGGDGERLSRLAFVNGTSELSNGVPGQASAASKHEQSREGGTKWDPEYNFVPPSLVSAASERDDDAFGEVRRQLDEYFGGRRREFDLDLDLRGTAWELSVWAALQEIPHGETRSYGEIARKVCTVKASRAVGRANNRNPVAIIVPCHRVIGADGSLTGYAGGLDRKRTLLDLEAGRLVLAM